MADAPKPLGQAYPAAATLTDLYAVPGGKYAVISTVVVCNQAATPAKFRLSVAVAGAADSTKQYIRYDVPVAGNDGFDVTIGVTLGATDVLRCQSDTGLVAFNAFGVEVT